MTHEKLKAPLRWYGGKGNMLAKLLPLIPEGGYPYCEPFCGSASLLFARAPAPVEVINDIDGDIVNVFRVLQCPESAEKFRYLVNVTPYARSELERALEIWHTGTDDPVLRAWAFFVRCNMGFSGKPAKSAGDWGRSFISTNGMSKKANEWLMRLTMIDAWRWRLMMVQIDNRNAIEVIRYWDNPKAVFYVDPPYIPETRKPGSRSVYKNELSREDHNALTDTLLKCEGAVVLSGYRDQEIHSPLEQSGWARVDFVTACHAAGRIRGSGLTGKGTVTKKQKRVESVWINQKAISLLPKEIQESIKDMQTQQEREDRPLQLKLF